jgi:hypothetical protein
MQPQTKKGTTTGEWQTIELSRKHKLVVGTVSSEIMEQMPTRTETFVERGVISSVTSRLGKLFGMNN